jgi:NAD(P)-dependent dehydrogenase (short-subunit alcohol dehydrogenase family)
MGGIDVLINNAGIGAIGDITEATEDEWANLVERERRRYRAHDQGGAARTSRRRRTPPSSTPHRSSRQSVYPSVRSTPRPRAPSSASRTPWRPTSPSSRFG